MPRPHSKEDLSRIPICTTDFLQDICLELGMRMNPVRVLRKADRLEFRVTTIEYEDEELESFDAVCLIENGSYIQVVIVESGIANYMFCQRSSRQSDPHYIGFIASL